MTLTGSRFHVGAALLLDDGTIIQGANVENASYGGAICAERTAIVKWQTDPAHRHKRVSGVAVASEAQAPCPPCGICRQVLREFCSMDTPILLPKSNWKPTDNTSSQPTTVVSSLSDPDLAVLLFEDLLPMSFGPTQLE